MPSRRAVLRGAGVGVAAGLAGCAGLLSDSDGSSDASSDASSGAFLANPDVATLADVSIDDRSHVVDLNLVDGDGVRPHREVLAGDRIGRLPGAIRVDSEPQTDWIERLSTVVDVQYRTLSREEGAFVSGTAVYAAGSFDADQYLADAGIESPASETHRDYDLYLGEETPRVAVRDGTVLRAAADQVTHVEDGEEVAGEPGALEQSLLRDWIDRVEDRPEPGDWVADALSRSRPAHLAEVHLEVASDGSDYVRARGQEVHGAESTYREAYASPTAEAFQAIWDPAALRERLATQADATPTVDAGDTAGRAEITVPSDQRWI